VQLRATWRSDGARAAVLVARGSQAGAAVAVAEVEPEPCFGCGTPTTRHMGPSRPVITIFEDDGTQRETYLLPWVPTCGDCMQAVVRGQMAFGWCDTCRVWGVKGQPSACGTVFDYS
jgi:hypothetical protein